MIAHSTNMNVVAIRRPGHVRAHQEFVAIRIFHISSSS